jgi:hypothetical protein
VLEKQFSLREDFPPQKPYQTFPTRVDGEPKPDIFVGYLADLLLRISISSNNSNLAE